MTKKDFELKTIEVRLHDENGAVKEARVITKDRYDEWSFILSKERLGSDVTAIVTDATGRATLFRIQ